MSAAVGFFSSVITIGLFVYPHIKRIRESTQEQNKNLKQVHALWIYKNQHEAINDMYEDAKKSRTITCFTSYASAFTEDESKLLPLLSNKSTKKYKSIRIMMYNPESESAYNRMTDTETRDYKLRIEKAILLLEGFEKVRLALHNENMRFKVYIFDKTMYLGFKNGNEISTLLPIWRISKDSILYKTFNQQCDDLWGKYYNYNSEARVSVTLEQSAWKKLESLQETHVLEVFENQGKAIKSIYLDAEKSKRIYCYSPLGTTFLDKAFDLYKLLIEKRGKCDIKFIIVDPKSPEAQQCAEEMNIDGFMGKLTASVDSLVKNGIEYAFHREVLSFRVYMFDEVMYLGFIINGKKELYPFDLPIWKIGKDSPLYIAYSERFDGAWKKYCNTTPEGETLEKESPEIKTYANQLEAIDSIYEDAKNSTIIYGYAPLGFTFSDGGHNTLYELLNKENCDMKFLVLNPEAPEAHQYEEEINVPGFVERVKGSIKSLKAHKNVKYALHNEVIRYRVYIFDKALYLGFIMSGKHPYSLPLLRVSKENALYNEYVQQFKHLWKKYNPDTSEDKAIKEDKK